MYKEKRYPRAHLDGLLRNIINYFSNQDAFVQELLQNARRAEASEVVVAIDNKNKSITITDNGHGVVDPDDLINIGKSEWSDRVDVEQPAGMGLFSVFKHFKKLTVRSGRWKITMDYPELVNGQPAIYEGGLPNIKGTTVTAYDPKDAATSILGNYPVWLRVARFMPFRTIVREDGLIVNTTEPFDPRATQPDAIRVDAEWGSAQILLSVSNVLRSTPSYRPFHLLQQGVMVQLPSQLEISTAVILVVANAGTFNLSLPDRDCVLWDETYKRMMPIIQRDVASAVIKALNTTHRQSPYLYKLVDLVIGLAPERISELPDDCPCIAVHELPKRMTKQDLVSFAADNGKLLANRQNYGIQLLPFKVLTVGSSASLVKHLVPDLRVVDSIRFTVVNDPRHPLIKQCTGIQVEYCADQTTEDLIPAPRQLAVMARYDKNVCMDSGHTNNADLEEDWVAVHTFPPNEELPLPDDSDMDWLFDDEDQSSIDLWEHSGLMTALLATQTSFPCVFVSDKTLESFVRNKLKISDKEKVRFTDTTFTVDEGLHIDAMTVQIIDDHERVVSETRFYRKGHELVKDRTC